VKPALFNPLDYPCILEKPRRLTDILSWQEHIPFAFTVIQLLRPRVFVELGTHKGDSYCAFCQAIQTTKLDCICYAIDTWEGDEETGLYGPEVLEELRLNHDPLYGAFSTLLKCRFDEALVHFSDAMIDLLHIDGRHDFEPVKHDFETWLPKMSDQGVVLLHDTNVCEPGFGVRQLWQEIKEHYPHFEFKHGYGLGVLGVGRNLPKNMESFLSMQEKDKVLVASFFAFLGGKIAFEPRMRRDFEEKISKKDEAVQNLLVHSENLGKTISENDKTIKGLVAHSENLAKVINTKDADIRSLEEGLRDLETRLLASLEQNSFLVGRIEDLEASLDSYFRQTEELHRQNQELSQHNENLERIVNHPLVKAMRACKKTLKFRR